MPDTERPNRNGKPLSNKWWDTRVVASCAPTRPTYSRCICVSVPTAQLCIVRERVNTNLYPFKMSPLTHTHIVERSRVQMITKDPPRVVLQCMGYSPFGWVECVWWLNTVNYSHVMFISNWCTPAVRRPFAGLQRRCRVHIICTLVCTLTVRFFMLEAAHVCVLAHNSCARPLDAMKFRWGGWVPIPEYCRLGAIERACTAHMCPHPTKWMAHI